MPDIPDGPVVAWLSYPGSPGGELWYSVRTAPGTWSDPLVYADSTDVGSDSHGVAWPSADTSAAVEIVGGKRDVISYGGPRIVADGRAYGTPYFLGQGFGAACYPIAVDNIDSSVYVLDNLQYFGMSHGCWRIGGHLYCLLQVNQIGLTTPQWTLTMVKAIAFDGAGIPTLWHAMDQSHAPVMAETLTSACAARWDGSSATVNVCANSSGSTTNFALYTFNTATDTWSAAFGVQNFGRTIRFGPATLDRGFHGNSIFKFPNGDIGIVYVEANTERKAFYRFWNGSAWSSEFTIIDYSVTPDVPIQLGQVVPDEAGESLHVFISYYVVTGGAPNFAGKYHIVEHDGTVHSNLFTFPTMTTTPGFEKAIIYSGDLLIAWSDGSDATATHKVWVGPVTGGSTTFTQESIPRPSSMAGLAPGPVYLAKIKAAIYIPPGANNRAYIGGFARTV